MKILPPLRPQYMRPYSLALLAAFFLILPPGYAQHVSREPTALPPDNYTLITRPKPLIIVPSADSVYFGGVNTKGDTIFPVRYYNINDYPLGVPIKNGIIYLLDTDRHRYQRAGFTVLPGYETKAGAFTRGGLLLYEPVWYDNGVDYWLEGRQRFVYDNKMGFVNRFGQVAVPAIYPYVTPYEKGYAIACLDCVYKTIDSADTEHGRGFAGTHYAIIDKRGRIVTQDSLNGARWPERPAQPLSLTPLEQRLAARLLQLPEAKDFGQSYLHTSMKDVRVILFDKPFKHSPYYHFGFQMVNDDAFTGAEYQFLISPDGKTILHIDRYLQKIQTLPVWRKEVYDTFEE